MSGEYLETMVGKFIFRVKLGCLYTEDGVWAAWDESTGLARLGLTDFRQQSDGDVAFVELPSVGDRVARGEDLANIETVKVDVAVPAPFSGEIVAVNEALDEAPELMNQQPYDAGWLVDLRPAAWPVEGLLDAAAYLSHMRSQAEANS